MRLSALPLTLVDRFLTSCGEAKRFLSFYLSLSLLSLGLFSPAHAQWKAISIDDKLIGDMIKEDIGIDIDIDMITEEIGIDISDIGLLGEKYIQSKSVLPRKGTLSYPHEKKKGKITIFQGCTLVSIGFDSQEEIPEFGGGKLIIPMTYLVDGKTYSIPSIAIPGNTGRILLSQSSHKFVQTILNGKRNMEVIFNTEKWGSPHFRWSLGNFRRSVEIACPNMSFN